MKKYDLVIPIGVLILFIISYIIVSVYITVFSEVHEQNIIRDQLESESCNNSYTELEQHKFYLKETSIDNPISAKISGSHLLIVGSIYGYISENKYINVVYFDDDTVIDNTTGVYKLTKFDLESIEIVTIPKNETPYFKYIGNSFSYDKIFMECKQSIGEPRLFLSEGWTILNTN